ncbi:hypothetical protein QM806_38805 [Rhodococcus sp. IEGM 1351]|uniref:hypothetical protein n=1 Tax=Rhodococcus sp. IEGM 1351 TaxID=3047089 RepID=UPI0024B6E9C0|nr:hypothetical protein [Rhodococcus sp. IEGM 1351]MDI9941300.1 hypothetical protein [Rhodococcus sp. IEGM 1351]
MIFSRIFPQASSLVASGGAALGSLKREWSEFDPQGRETLASAVQHGSIDEHEPTPAVADNVLAFAWIYGDVVHNDSERLAETTQHGVAERYRAAAPIVCRLIVQTVATLHFIEWLRAQDLITLPQAIFEQQVVVTDPVFREKVAVFMAPAGEEMPPLPLRVGDELGPEWRRLVAPSPVADVGTDLDRKPMADKGYPARSANQLGVAHRLRCSEKACRAVHGHARGRHQVCRGYRDLPNPQPRRAGGDGPHARQRVADARPM